MIITVKFQTNPKMYVEKLQDTYRKHTLRQGHQNI